MVMAQVNNGFDTSFLQFYENIWIIHVRLNAAPQFLINLCKVRDTVNATITRQRPDMGRGCVGPCRTPGTENSQ